MYTVSLCWYKKVAAEGLLTHGVAASVLDHVQLVQEPLSVPLVVVVAEVVAVVDPGGVGTRQDDMMTILDEVHALYLQP